MGFRLKQMLVTKDQWVRGKREKSQKRILEI